MVRGLLATFLAYASNSAGVGNGADLILCMVSPGMENKTDQDRREEETVSKVECEKSKKSTMKDNLI